LKTSVVRIAAVVGALAAFLPGVVAQAAAAPRREAINIRRIVVQCDIDAGRADRARVDAICLDLIAMANRLSGGRPAAMSPAGVPPRLQSTDLLLRLQGQLPPGEAILNAELRAAWLPTGEEPMPAPVTVIGTIGDAISGGDVGGLDKELEKAVATVLEPVMPRGRRRARG